MTRFLATLGLALVLGLGGCHKKHKKSSSPPPPPPGVTGDSFVSTTATPPVGLTWLVAINENVDQATMDAWYAKFVTLSTNLWNVSEGQVWIGKVVFTDNVKPGYLASTMIGFNVPAPVDTYDAMIFMGATWDIGAGGFVIVGTGLGRNDRMIGVPDAAGDLTNVHEGSHMIFELSWAPGPLLTDEYGDGSQDAACIMELRWVPLKWCSASNHVTQSAQPTSCWEQVLADYANFTYGGTDIAATPPPTTDVEYNNTP